MATPIITPTLIRGSLMFVLGDVAFPSLKSALCAWSAIDALIDRRQACLSTMRASVGDVEAFAAASREEAALAARIRRLRHADTPVDPYRQDIWDSFPQLQKPALSAAIR